uniref:Uncharacterized protein n=1 Tax=Avena sativa TaxID=4498 RepID=A0ACD5YU71_AVESA
MSGQREAAGATNLAPTAVAIGPVGRCARRGAAEKTHSAVHRAQRQSVVVLGSRRPPYLCRFYHWTWSPLFSSSSSQSFPEQASERTSLITAVLLRLLAGVTVRTTGRMGRSPCCEKEGVLKKGPWTPEEDQKLLAHIDQHGHGCWRSLPAKAGLRRCGKSCRLRWTNYLRPDIKRGKFTLQEEQSIIQLHALLGNRWSAIATHLPKRTDNEIKNYWNTHLKKRLAKMGIDPVTHKPRADADADAAGSGAGAGARSRVAAHLSHTAQWESTRLEAEARLAREAKLRALASPPPASSVLDSPTSTLSFSFSDSALFAGAGAAAHDMHHGAARASAQPLHSYEDDHHFGAGTGTFASVLLDCSVAGTDQRLVVALPDASSGEQNEEEDRGYWSSILNMVDSSISSSLTSEVVTDPAMYLPPATGEF